MSNILNSINHIGHIRETNDVTICVSYLGIILNKKKYFKYFDDDKHNWMVIFRTSKMMTGTELGIEYLFRRK